METVSLTKEDISVEKVSEVMGWNKDRHNKLYYIYTRYSSGKTFILQDITSETFFKLLIDCGVFQFSVRDNVLNITRKIPVTGVFFSQQEIETCNSTGFSDLPLNVIHKEIARKKFRYSVLMDLFKRDTNLFKLLIIVHFYSRNIVKKPDFPKEVVKDIINNDFHIYDRIVLSKGASYLVTLLTEEKNHRIRNHLTVTIKQFLGQDYFLTDPLSLALFDLRRDMLHCLDTTTIEIISGIRIVYNDRLDFLCKMESIFSGVGVTIFRIINERYYRAGILLGGSHGSTQGIALGHIDRYYLIDSRFISNHNIINKVRRRRDRFYIREYDLSLTKKHVIEILRLLD